MREEIQDSGWFLRKNWPVSCFSSLLDTIKKNLYFNYFIFFSDDDDDEIDAAKVGTKTGQNTTTNKQNTVLEAAAAVAEVAAEDEDGSEPESEWEYFYEDAELKKPDGT